MRLLPTQNEMYRALLRRDESFEGVFFFAVRTTRIFCRPTCPARKPKSENVEFFSDAHSALLAGYRPCQRCRPMHGNGVIPDSVTRLMQLVDESPSRRLREQNLREMGLDPSTVRRQFQKYFGMTFHAYQRARHMGQALQTIREGTEVLPAQLNSGYESASGFWSSFRQVFGESPSNAGRVNALAAKWIDTVLGPMLAVADDRGLRLLEFVDRRALETEIALIRRKTGCIVVPGEHPILDQIESELDAYFQGSKLQFETPVELCGSSFEQDVWRELQSIPVGHTHSYAQVARAVNRSEAVRAVGRANGKNCLAIIVPCHRVIGSNGKLTGYGGGLWRKQWLLDHERKHT